MDDELKYDINEVDNEDTIEEYKYRPRFNHSPQHIPLHKQPPHVPYPHTHTQRKQQQHHRNYEKRTHQQSVPPSSNSGIRPDYQAMWKSVEIGVQSIHENISNLKDTTATTTGNIHEIMNWTKNQEDKLEYLVTTASEKDIDNIRNDIKSLHKDVDDVKAQLGSIRAELQNLRLDELFVRFEKYLLGKPWNT